MMRIDLPQCNFKNCRFSFDGNCTNKIEYDRCEYRIEEDELIKAEPVRHGRWLTWEQILNVDKRAANNLGVFCSVCNKHSDNMTNYCPVCGAEMDGGGRMKIYQLHKYGGVWEESYDYIIGSYLRKERAEEEKNKAEIKEKELVEQSGKCFECPFIEQDNEDLDSLLSEHPSYCTKLKLSKTEYGIINCDNYYDHWDDATFSVKEVEVEE